jgi:ribosomal protein S12 methylthiotransferase
MPKVSIVSLGCPKNLVDSDSLVARLQKEGFLYTPEPAEADFVLVNTCGFIQDAKKESIEEILKLRPVREKGGKLLVFGCLAQRYADQLRAEIPEIDGLWGVGEEEKIVDYCKKASGRMRSRVAAGRRKEIPGDTPSHPGRMPYAYLKVAEGCSRGCTYCVIPSLRGPFRSMEPDSIVQKAEDHIRAGAKELVLVAQDLGNYGREYEGYRLSSLVREIAALSGDFWIRLLYLNPTSITDELLSVVAGEAKVCKYLDIPLQHSEKEILRAMGRGGTRQSLAGLIRKIRRAIPSVTLRTTFIVGFPGETEEEFASLKRFIEEMRFERLGVFTYSKEEGTPAAKMKGSVPAKTRERRRDEVMKLQSSISLENNKALVGRTFRALVDEIEGETAIARLSSQAPEIDGVVFIDTGTGSGRDGKKTRREKERMVGEFVEVRIVEAYDYDLKGEPAA